MVGATRFISCLSQHKLPIVLHNGLLDLLHIHEKVSCVAAYSILHERR